MAIQTELGDGQITPAARPVEAFIQPGQRNVAQPNALPQLGNPGGISTVGTGGTPSVQGRNSFADFAQALAPFSRELTQTLQTAGLMYADAQMKAGERYAREQSLAAMAANDADMEVSELERARTNRQVGAKDPTAGQFMSFLNPYFGMGVERGNAKLAGKQAEMGLQAYIAKNRDRVDYNAPDMGFGALAQLQAEYTNGLAKDYGLSAGSPGFQKYTLPAIEKSMDVVQTRHLSDRKEYFDTTAVNQAVGLIRKIYESAESNGFVEFNGSKIYRDKDPASFLLLRNLSANQALENLVLRSSEPGDAGKRTSSVYKALTALGIYNSTPGFQEFVDNLQGSAIEKGTDGKAIIDPDTGQPRRLPMGAQFQLDLVDTEVKYDDALEKRQKRELSKPELGFDDVILRAGSGLPEGPARKAAIDQAQEEWYQTNGRASGISRFDLTKRRNELIKERNTLSYEGDDPTVVSRFWRDLDQTMGADFKASEWRTQRIPAAAAAIRDPDERARFERSSREMVASREKEQAQMSPYSRARDSELNRMITANLDRWYDKSDPDQKDLREESARRQRFALTARINDKIGSQEALLKRRLTESEVLQITRASFYGDKALGMDAYGAGKGGGKPGTRVDDLFPGAPRSRAQAPLGPDGVVPRKQYAISQLGQVPDQRVFQNYKSYRILTPDATEDAWQMLSRGQALPPALTKAVKASGAGSAAEFVLRQVDLQRNYLYRLDPQGDDWRKFNPSQEDRQRVLSTGRRAAAGGATVQSVASNVQRTPLLAQLGGSVLNALTGATPAAAGTLDSAPRQYGGTGGGRPSQQPLQPQRTQSSAPSAPAGGGSAMVAPEAPRLPAPVGGGRGPEVAMASPAPSVRGGSSAGSAGLGVTVRGPQDLPPGWYLDERGMPATSTPAWAPTRPRLRAVRTDYGEMAGPPGGFEKPVSVVYERSGGQPGVDLYFPSKRFPAVLGGVVKDVSSQGGPGSGYGNYVVVESVDPLSGRKVDVLYAHLADGVSVRPGQRIAAGQIIGKQGGTGRVVSQDGTIASIDFLEPRPAGSKGMKPYSGFDQLRRHVVKQLQSGGSGGGASGKPDAYLKRLSYLETRIRNIPNSQGSGAMGYFQAMGPFTQEAIAASGGISPRDGDYNRSAKATWAWIQKHRPQAAAAIKAGRYDEADRILRPTWPSLPGGSQAQPDYVQREARRYLGG